MIKNFNLANIMNLLTHYTKGTYIHNIIIMGNNAYKITDNRLPSQYY
jgi:hypothetical protein